jgi:excisionase family DNA binding protein
MSSREINEIDSRERTLADSAELVADGLLTVKECAEFLHLSRSKIYELMDAGELCFAKLGRSRRIPRRAVIALAAREIRGGRRQSR